MESLTCPNCGGTLPAHSAKLEVITCEFCSTNFRKSATLTPEPDMGDLLLGADFSKKPIVGWELIGEERLSLHGGKPSELRGKFASSINAYYVMKSSGLFDDLDVSVSIKFTEGNAEFIRAGIYTRYDPNVGGYGFLISAQTSYTFGYISKDEKNELIFTKTMPWAYHYALHAGLNQTNRLRVICNGEKFRVYINGVLAASFKDTRYELGKVYLVAEPSEKSDLGMAFSDLQLRDVLG
jgi:hypothetical protein